MERTDLVSNYVGIQQSLVAIVGQKREVTNKIKNLVAAGFIMIA